MLKSLFKLNPDIDRIPLARRFAQDSRVQIRNVLTDESAREIRHVLQSATPWGLAWQAGNHGPNLMRADQVRDPEHRGRLQTMMESTHKAAASRGEDYAFRFGSYPMLDAYREKWAEGSAQDILLEHLNTQEYLGLLRDVTGIDALKKADAQATLYGPNHFLATHDDSHVAEGWRVAYVLNFADADWRPEWGGYLNFHAEDGDIVAGWKPRFNALNLFLVPQRHAVSYVPPFAPAGRFAITGWARDR
ncbi:2OG-Fe(II) oxygenase family protein [Croceicoccus sp. YJ47]|uniref:2OG-Fe(II) oxygenase n=1 Tax=Croceicoccus sp. YJ47 TaxID=2798724 RepID=UPI001921830D|nr:2OG-Fe(II) oxygenase family protein [Croceicoccus sp. YJ47]QQN74133.1 2OG-Fe(II) oxygenase [Croceicoccus sp. YJ47]